MAELLPQHHRGLELPEGSTWRERRHTADLRARAQVVEYKEHAEAVRLGTRMACGRMLADRAAFELVSVHQEITELSAGDPGLELELRDIERVLGAGYRTILRDYLTGWCAS